MPLEHLTVVRVRAGHRTRPPRGAHPRQVNAPIPLRRRAVPGAAMGAFLVGLATTLYLSLAEWQSVTLRPVQLVPATLVPLALLLPRTFAVSSRLRLHFLAFLWLVYMAGRFLLLAPTDPLTAVRAVTCIATFFTAMELSIRQKQPHAVVIGLVAGCLASVAVSAADITVFGVEPRYYGSARWTGWMPGPNRLADLCGVACVICLAMVIQPAKSATCYAWALCLAVCGGGLLASGSRGGLFATAVASVATIWISSKVQNKRLRLSTYLKPMAWLCILGGASFYFFGGHISERVSEFVTLSRDGRANVEDDPRREIAFAALEKFQNSPFVGGGTEFLSLDNAELSSHNSYLYLLSTSGLIGFGLYATLLVAIARRLWRIVQQRSIPVEVKSLATPALGGLVFLLVHMCVIDLVLSSHVWAFFGYAAAVAVRSTETIARTAPQHRRKKCA